MKTLGLFFLCLIIFVSLNYSQDSNYVEPTIKRLPLAKKRQISKLLRDIFVGTDVYLNFTDSKAIVIASAETIKRIRKMTATLPKSFFRDSLVTGAGAWEKSLWFRYEEIGNVMLSMNKRNEIIEVYKLEEVPSEDRPAKLFAVAQAMFDTAANIAVASGVPTK